MNSKTIEVIKNSFTENRNSHAFLVETNNVEMCLDDIKKIILDINNISREIILENIPDVKIIFPDGKEIKKEQISVIKNDFLTYPVELKHRYYIIVSSELMNQSATNVILKFLEEPDNAVVGFFITNNRKSMLDTMVSRCQQYKLFYNSTFLYDEEMVNSFINNMNLKEIYKRILFLNKFIEKDRTENIRKFKEIISYLLERDDVYSDVNLLVKRVNLLDNIIVRLTKNANNELILLDLAINWEWK